MGVLLREGKRGAYSNGGGKNEWVGKGSPSSQNPAKYAVRQKYVVSEDAV